MNVGSFRHFSPPVRSNGSGVVDELDYIQLSWWYRSTREKLKHKPFFFFLWVPFEAVRFEETFGWVVLQEPSIGYIPNKFRLWLIYAWFMVVYQPISYFIVIFILSHPTRINYPRVI